MLWEADIMGVLFTVALCLLGLLALTTQCVTGDAPNTTMASADVTKDGGIVTSGLTSGVTDLVSGNRLTDTDKRGQRLKEGHKRDGRKSKKGRRGQNRRKGKNIQNKTSNRKKSFKAGPGEQQMKELPRSHMRYQDCVQWDPEANITLNLTEKSLSVDYCNPHMASLPETHVCLIGEKSDSYCRFVNSDSCSTMFENLANGNYSVWIQPVCDTCVRTGVKPCPSPGYFYRGYIMQDPPTLIPPTVDLPGNKHKRSMALELVLAISAGCGLSVVVIGLVVVYCIRKNKPFQSESSSESPTTGPSSPESPATEIGDDGNSPQSEQFREQHQYEPLIPFTETIHQTVPKTTAGGTRASALLRNSSDAHRCSPCSYTEETETSFAVRDRKEASPLLQNSSDVCHGRSQTMEAEDSLHTLPFSPGRLIPAYSFRSLGSCVTIDHHDWSGDPTPSRAAAPATPSLFSWNGATLAECIEMDNKGPGIMNTSGKRRNEFSELIPMNVDLILNANGRNQKPWEDKQATLGGNLQESEETMFNCDKDQSVLDTSEEKLYENTGHVTQDLPIPEVTIVKSGLDQYRQDASQGKFCEKMAHQIRRKMEDSYGHERNKVEDYD